MRFFKKIAVSLLFFISLATISSGQESKFTQFEHDSVKFLDNLESYMNTGLADKGSVNAFMKQ